MSNARTQDGYAVSKDGYATTCPQCCGNTQEPPTDSCCVGFWPLGDPPPVRYEAINVYQAGQPPVGQGIAVTASISVTMTRASASGSITRVYNGSISSPGGGPCVAGSCYDLGESLGIDAGVCQDAGTYSFSVQDTIVTQSGTTNASYSAVNAGVSASHGCFPRTFYEIDGTPEPLTGEWGLASASATCAMRNNATGLFTLVPGTGAGFRIVANLDNNTYTCAVSGPGWRVGPAGLGWTRTYCVTPSFSPDYSSGSATVSVNQNISYDGATYTATGTITVSWQVLIPPTLCPDKAIPVYAYADCDDEPVDPCLSEGGAILPSGCCDGSLNPDQPPCNEPDPVCCPTASGFYFDTPAGVEIAASWRIVQRVRSTGVIIRQWQGAIPRFYKAVNPAQSDCRQLRTSVTLTSDPGNGIESFIYDPQDSPQIINAAFVLSIDLGEDAVLPTGAAVTLRVFNGTTTGSGTAFAITRNAAGCTITTSTAIPVSALPGLSEESCEFLGSGGFFHTALQSYNTPGGQFIVGNTIYEIRVGFDVSGKRYAQCPGGAGTASLDVGLSMLASAPPASPSRGCSSCGKGKATGGMTL